MNSGIFLRFVAIAGLVVAVSACTRILSVSAANPERPSLDDGRPILRSRQKNRVDVVLRRRKFSYKLETLPALYVQVRNGGDAPFAFSTKKITAYSGKARMQVYTLGQLIAWFNRDEELKKLQEAHATWEVGPDTPSDSSGNMEQAERIRNAGLDRTMRWGVLLRSQLVVPGETAGGVVKLDAEDIKTGQPLYLTVTVAGEAHRFVFDVGNG